MTREGGKQTRFRDENSAAPFTGPGSDRRHPRPIRQSRQGRERGPASGRSSREWAGPCDLRAGGREVCDPGPAPPAGCRSRTVGGPGGCPSSFNSARQFPRKARPARAAPRRHVACIWQGHPSLWRRPAMTREQLNSYRKELLTLAASLDRGLAHDRREFRREEEPDRARRPDALDGGRGGRRGRGGGDRVDGHRGAAAAGGRWPPWIGSTTGRSAPAQECGRQIPQGRLDALPYARQCIRCTRAATPIAG